MRILHPSVSLGLLAIAASSSAFQQPKSWTTFTNNRRILHMTENREEKSNNPHDPSRRDLLSLFALVSGGLPASSVVAENNVLRSGAQVEGGSSGCDALQIPFSSVRRYKTVKLANGLRVLLVSDDRAFQASAALTISGAGQFADPSDLPGLAHFMEHMISSYNSRTKFRQSSDFEDWLSDRDGASNAFTAYDKVCFHFSCPSSAFSEALERFAGLFTDANVVNVCSNANTRRREIRRVDSELDYSDVSTQERYLVKSFVNLDNPFSRFSAGSLDTLERRPAEANTDMGERLIEFFRAHYLPSNAVLVVIAPLELLLLDRIVAPFASTLSKVSSKGLTKNNTRYTGGFLQGNFRKQMVLYRQEENDDSSEMLSFQWALNLDYSSERGTGKAIVTASQIAFVLSQILGRHGPGSLYFFLLRRGWIIGNKTYPRISLPLDVDGFQIIKLQIPLTLEGFINRSAAVAAVYDMIKGTKVTRYLISQFATIAKLQGYILAPRPPDAVELAVDAQLYPLIGPNGIASGNWYRMPSPEETSLIPLQRAVNVALSSMNDPENTVIIATAGKKAMGKSGLVDEGLPPLDSPRWRTEPVSGAKIYYDDMLRLSARVEELVLKRLIDNQELQGPVQNPLVPAILRPPRVLGCPGKGNDKVIYPTLIDGSTVLRHRTTAALRNEGTNWLILEPTPGQRGIPLPRGPPEPTCRCAFVLQLLSSRPARANTRQAAQAMLWKVSFENAVSDLAELGLPGGLGYELTFNKVLLAAVISLTIQLLVLTSSFFLVWGTILFSRTESDIAVLLPPLLPPLRRPSFPPFGRPRDVAFGSYPGYHRNHQHGSWCSTATTKAPCKQCSSIDRF
jgi:insulysin